MSNIPEHLKERLDTLAYQESTPYCYGCAVDAPEGRCPRCGSDDLMRHLKGVGAQWGTDWVIEHLLREDLTAIDTEEGFAESVRESYGETTKIGWIEVDTVDTIKAMDQVSFELAESEWIDSLAQDEQAMSPDNGGAWYWVHDVESFLDGKGV